MSAFPTVEPDRRRPRSAGPTHRSGWPRTRCAAPRAEPSGTARSRISRARGRAVRAAADRSTRSAARTRDTKGSPVLGIDKTAAVADACDVGEFRVYLCDDDDGYRTLVRTVLSEDGMQIVGDSGDGAACVEAVEQAVADVVLLDLNMPGMNGFETLARLRDRLPAVRVIVLSTAADQTSQSAALRLGADGFISKPMRIFDLPDLVREAVRAAGEVAGGHATEAVNP